MKQFLIFLLFFVTILTTPSMFFARAGTQSGASDDHTAREEKEGKEILADSIISLEKTDILLHRLFNRYKKIREAL